MAASAIKSVLKTVPLSINKENRNVLCANFSGSDAESHVKSISPHKTAKIIGNGLRPNSVQGFLEALPLVFQRDQA